MAVVTKILWFSFASFSTIIPLLILRNIRTKYKKLLARKVVDNNFYKPMFFSIENWDCKWHIYRSLPCEDTCAYYDLQYIVEFIKTASHTLNVCMCLLTAIEIQDALINAQEKGIRVRYITDRTMAENVSTRLPHLKSSGVIIKTQNAPDDVIHHKFCYADEDHPSKCKLFFGTLNLTIQGITGNWDTIIFTNNKYMIKQYRKVFENLWNETVEY